MSKIKKKSNVIHVDFKKIHHDKIKSKENNHRIDAINRILEYAETLDWENPKNK